MARLLTVPAIELRQGPNRLLYQFGVDGKLLPEFATVSRVRRDEREAVDGYQRPEALAHIASIRRYIESDDPLLPNSIVIAFDGRVRFKAAPGQRRGAQTRIGDLFIPLDPSNPPGWIVDGQQRSAAVREANVRSFPMAVVAFVTTSQAEQREQFILVNSVKPLPKSLIYELLPTTDALLPTALARRKLPALILDDLNHDPDSPFFRRIQTPTNPDGTIKDNSVLRMLDNSLSDGVLYRYREGASGRGDVDAMCGVVNAFWTAAAALFPEAWDTTPRRSRLVHGVGIVAMGYLMDAIADYGAAMSTDLFIEHLKLIEPVCQWTAGVWDFGPGVSRRWNELQNTPRDVQLLANCLLNVHRQAAKSLRENG
jgi:DGQHR domain-containing protein